jgi:hypothetical protein
MTMRFGGGASCERPDSRGKRERDLGIMGNGNRGSRDGKRPQEDDSHVTLADQPLLVAPAMPLCQNEAEGVWRGLCFGPREKV